MKKTILFTVLVVISICCYAQSNMKLKYKKPAMSCGDRFPLGDGRLGALPDNKIIHENIVLNEISLWAGEHHNSYKERAVQYLPEIRKLLSEGKVNKVTDLTNKTFVPGGKGCAGERTTNMHHDYPQNLGNLHLEYDYGIKKPLIKPRNYIRELLLDSAIAKCQYEIDGVTYYREYFTSFPQDVIIIRLSANKPGKVSVTLSLNHLEQYKTTVNGKELDMEGQLNNGTGGKSMHYMVRVRMKPDGGKLITGDSTLQLKKANAAVIYISAGTDYESSSFGLNATTLTLLYAAWSKSYQEAKMEHIKAYQQPFGNSSFLLHPKN